MLRGENHGILAVALILWFISRKNPPNHTHKWNLFNMACTSKFTHDKWIGRIDSLAHSSKPIRNAEVRKPRIKIGLIMIWAQCDHRKGLIKPTRQFVPTFRFWDTPRDNPLQRRTCVLMFRVLPVQMFRTILQGFGTYKAENSTGSEMNFLKKENLRWMFQVWFELTHNLPWNRPAPNSCSLVPPSDLPPDKRSPKICFTCSFPLF